MNSESLIPLMLAQATSLSRTNVQWNISHEEIIRLTADYGLKALAGLVVFVVGMLAARWTGKFVKRVLSKREMDPPLALLLERAAKLLVLVLAMLMAIQQLGFKLLPLIAGLSVAGVGIGLAMQGVLSNLVAGLTIIFVRKFRVGEYIEIHDQTGRVEMIELFATTLVRADKSRIIIPNRKIVGEIIHNYGTIRQLDLAVGVAYSTDLNVALRVLKTVIESNPKVLKDPPPVIGTSVLADSSIVLAVKPWVLLTDFIPAQAELYKAIIEAFRANQVQIPFPQREIRVLSGSEIKSVAA